VNERDTEASWRKAWVAGEVLVETGADRVRESVLGRDLLSRARSRLVSLLRGGRLSPVERAAAGTALGSLVDPRFRAEAWYLPDEELLGFVEIPEGPFRMGSDKRKDPDASPDEFDQHPLTLPAYYIARYPVTVAQWRVFVEEDSSRRRKDPDPLRGVANHPVVWISWDEAMEYCAWLTGKLREWPETPERLARLLRGETPDGKKWRVTLPSEAEWEKATRGRDGLIFPWGDRPDPDRANYGDTGIGTTSAVGCFPRGASPYGVEDLSGNVWEWTRSLWGKEWDKPHYRYPYKPLDGRENVKAPREWRRVLRGGAFFYAAGFSRCAGRNRLRSGRPLRRRRVPGGAVPIRL
jgi:formylglycine-generating enzyme required for sulfatase activity